MISKSICLMLAATFFFVQGSHATEMTKAELCERFSQLPSDKAIFAEYQTLGIFYEPGIDSSLLIELLSIFREYQINGKHRPLRVRVDNSRGPKKAWVTESGNGRVLNLSQNTEDLLFLKELRAKTALICESSVDRASGPIEFQLRWVNTVFEQVLRQLASADQLERVLKKRTGWALNSLSEDKELPFEQAFRKEELVTLSKQVIDLPEEVRRKLALKRIVRARVGRTLPNNAIGIYEPATQKIILSDGALIEGADIYGEGTVLHELGHAWWFAEPNRVFRDQFSLISWKRQGAQWVLQSSDAKEFVTAYAMKAPTEDFAECFSAYVNEPEKLKTLAPRKFDYLHQTVFKDTTYYSTAAKNAKIEINSQQPDKTPPWIDGPLEKCLSVSTHLSGEQNEVSVTIKCVRDDLSGPSSQLMSFEHPKIRDSYVFVNLEPLPQKENDGTWTLTGRGVQAISKVVSGEHIVKTLQLKDRAGNGKFYDVSKQARVYLTGTVSSLGVRAQAFSWSQVSLKSIPPVNGHLGFQIELPISHANSLSDLHLSWFHTQTEEKTTSVFLNCDRDLVSKPGDSTIRANLYFSKFHAAGTLQLNSITLKRRGTTEVQPHSEQFVRPQSVEASVQLPGPGIELIDVNVNQMKLTSVNQKNYQGGDWSIGLEIPITRPQGFEFEMAVVARSPSGKRLFFLVSESLMVRKGASFRNDQGLTWLQVPLALLPHPEKGEYLFESIELKTNPVRSVTDPRHLDQSNFVRRIKLLERGIQRKFIVRPDESLQLL